MAVELVIPQAGESITEVQVGEWLKGVGDHVERDESVVVIETEKAAMEIPAPAAGTLARIVKQQGEAAKPGDLIGLIAEAGEELPAGEVPPDEQPEALRRAQEEEGQAPAGTEATRPFAAAEGPAPAEALPRAAEAGRSPAPAPTGEAPAREEPRVMPAAQRELAQRGLSAADVPATGPGGRLLKEDVVRHAEGRASAAEAAPRPPKAVAPPDRGPAPRAPGPAAAAAREGSPRPPEAVAAPAVPAGPEEAPVALSPSAGAGSRQEEVVPMSLLRRRIAERLVEAQQNAALLTTFNEVDMSAVMALRKQHQPAFQERHGVKLGFMSFFVKAAVDALRRVPQVNAEIRGQDLVYHNYHDIGIAVGGGRGLVVPVLRNAERLSFSEIEKAIADFARRAQENKLTIEELQGGTFTITNGGVYGSMLSTPIVNPPQSAILGMHAIQERPMAHEGQVVVRPMMYLALTYDHRVIDGREAVTFLKRVKECIEEPSRMLLEV